VPDVFRSVVEMSKKSESFTRDDIVQSRFYLQVDNTTIPMRRSDLCEDLVVQ
jgi:hypothetical protein